jgi:hypothetical protein
VIRPRAYRILILVPLIAWTTHVAIGFSTVSLHCRRGYLSGSLLHLSATRAALAGVTLAAAIVIVAIAIAALRRRRAITGADQDTAEGGGLLMAVSALACCLLLLYLVWAVVLTSAGSVCT